jgi:hypothetical protein
MTKRKNLEILAAYGEKVIQEELSERYVDMQTAANVLKKLNTVSTRANYIMAISDYENMRNHANSLGIKPALKVDLEDWKSIIPHFNKNEYNKLLDTEE